MSARFDVWGTRGGSSRTLIISGVSRDEGVRIVHAWSHVYPMVWAHNPYVGTVALVRFGREV